jgi:membrane associated rhomboid family serine protease
MSGRWQEPRQFALGGPLTPAVKMLLIANVAVFLFQFVAQALAHVRLDRFFGLVPYDVTHHLFLWQLVTYMFLHAQTTLWHIGFNMLVLWFLGPQIEAVLGRARFLVLYFVSGLAGSVCVYWFSGEDTLTLGASGAIFGLMGALLVVAHKVRGDVQSIIGWLAINAVFTFLFPGVSWQGHLGGFLGGVLVTAILVYAPKDRRKAVQIAGITLITAALLAATLARTVVLA